MVRIPTYRQPTHPGEMLLEEFLIPMGITQQELANVIHVPYQRINEIVRGRREVTPSTALRLAKFFGVSAGLLAEPATALGLVQRPADRGERTGAYRGAMLAGTTRNGMKKPPRLTMNRSKADERRIASRIRLAGTAQRRGSRKYVERYRAGTNLVLLEPDVAKAFPSDQAVNEALRLVLKLTQIPQVKESTAVVGP